MTSGKPPTIHVRCPHCGQALAAKRETAGKTVPCPKCRKEITVPQAAEPSENDASPPGIEDLCWFCKKRLPDADPETVELHRIEKSTYIVVGAKVSYRATKINVPKCSACAKREEPYAFWFGCFPLLLLVLGAICWSSYVYFFDPFNTQEQCSAAMKLAMYVGCFALIVFLGLVPLGLIYWLGQTIAEQRGVPNEFQAREHPAVKALTAKGWKVGSAPTKNESLDSLWE